MVTWAFRVATWRQLKASGGRDINTDSILYGLEEYRSTLTSPSLFLQRLTSELSRTSEKDSDLSFLKINLKSDLES